MKQKYSFKKGLGKGFVTVLTLIATMAAFSGMADLQITDLITRYIFPVLGSLTIGGTLTVAINYIKFNYLS